MSKKYRNRFVMGMAVLAVGLLVAGRAMAGSLDPTNVPAPTMHTLQAIYDAIPPAQTLSATTAVVAAGLYAATNLMQVDTDLTGLMWARNANLFGPLN